MIRRACHLLVMASIAGSAPALAQAPLPPPSASAAPGMGAVPFSKYGPGGTAGVDASAAFASIRADTTSPTVFLPPGQYDVSECPADHYFRSSTSLVGAGMGRTIIKFTGMNCSSPNLFAWGGGSADFGARDLTIDWNGAVCQERVPSGGCSTFTVTNNTRARIENVEIIETVGDRWFHINAVGSSNGLLRANRIKPRDCVTDWTANTGIHVGGTYSLSSFRKGSISGNILTIETRSPKDSSSLKEEGSPISLGQAVVGGPDVPRDLFIAAFGTGTGTVGTYILNRAVDNPVAVGQVHLTSGYGWTIENNRLIGTNIFIDSPMNISRNNEIGPYCSGPAMNNSTSSTYFTSINDYGHDGPSNAGGDNLFDSGFEFHAPNTQVINSRVSNVSQACLSVTGARTIVRGGTCERFNTGAIEDATFTGSISGNLLTVTAVRRGKVQRGQGVAGAGVMPTTIQTGGTGTGGAGTYIIDNPQTVTSTAMTATLPGTGGGLYVSNGGDHGLDIAVSDYTVRGGCTAGETYCYSDNPGAKNVRIQGLRCNGISRSPYRILGGTTVVDAGAARVKP